MFEGIAMLISRTAIVEVAHTEPAAGTSQEKSADTKSHTPEIWSVERREDEPETGGIWSVERREDEPETPGIWSVERRGDEPETPGIWSVDK